MEVTGKGFGMLVLLDRRREFEDVIFGCTRFKVGRPGINWDRGGDLVRA
jgi:hypothetical protein